MSGYHERIQGTDRLLRIRLMRQVVYVVLIGLTILLLFIRETNGGASFKPLFIPLAGVLEVVLIMGLVGTGLGLYFKNLEVQRSARESQKYLMTKYSMSRSATTAGIALVLAIVLLVPLTAEAGGALLTEPAHYVALQPVGKTGDTVTYDFSTPDAFGVGFVRYVNVTVLAGSGPVLVTVLGPGGKSVAKNLSATQSWNFPVEPSGGAVLGNWSVTFQDRSPFTDSLTFLLPEGVMGELFTTVPFFLLLYFGVNLVWWFALRPIRESTKGEALYAGRSTETDSGERFYVEPVDAVEPAPVAPDAAPPPPPPPPPVPVPPPPALAAAPVAPVPVPAVPRPPPPPAPRPETAERLVAQGDSLLAAGEVGGALVAYDEALRIDSRFRPALLAKASALLSLKRPADALTVYNRLLAMDPNDEAALRASSRVLASLSRWREALEATDAYLAKRPNDAASLELKGDILASLGRRPESLSAYEAAQALDPRNENVKQKIEEVRVDVPGLLSRALIASASGNYPQALNLFDDILEVEPGNVNALIGKAVAYRRSGKNPEALNCLDLVLHIQPANAAALLNRGRILEEKGDLDGALASFDKLVAASPADDEAWSSQADLLAKMGRDEDALKAFREALRLNPGDEELQGKIRDLEASKQVSGDVAQELYKVKGIGPARAKALVDAGYRTAADYRKATVEDLLKVKGVTRKIAEDLVKHFRETALVEAR